MKNLVLVLLLIGDAVSGFGIYRGCLTGKQPNIEQSEVAAGTGVHDLGPEVEDKIEDGSRPANDRK